MRIDKNIEEWTKFERLFLGRSRRIKLFKMDMRTSAHVDLKGTGKTLVFIATSNGDFSTIWRTIGIPTHVKVDQHAFMIGKITSQTIKGFSLT